MLFNKSAAIAVCSAGSSSGPSSITSSLVGGGSWRSLRNKTCPSCSCSARLPGRESQTPSTRRHFASVVGNDSRRGEAEKRSNNTRHAAIPEWPKSKYPTPYEIFGLKKDAAYTKTRFFQLVKIYHPDTHDHNASVARTSPSHPLKGIPVSVLLERYHLVIAANDLLSDPAKRQLYDSQGVGWTGGRPQTIHDTMRNADRSWRHQPGSAAHNATWEDWERWYEQRDSDGTARRQPMYMSNAMFATIVVMLCMVGALAQRSRADSMGQQYVEWRAQTHEAIGGQMRRDSAALAGLSSEERISAFLRDRESAAWAYSPKKYDNPPIQEKES